MQVISLSLKEKRILVVDDEPKMVDVVKSYLENSGYTVYTAYNGRKALETFEEVNPSLIVLDLMLPDTTGEEICKTLRKKSSVPIIMLTAKIEEEDILKGLNIGADDYITKPFSPRQLIARVEAVLRRAEGIPATLISFNNNDLVIDTGNYDVKKNGISVNLTPNEYKILTSLIKYPKKAFTRDELIEIVTGNDFDGFDRVIDTHIKNLRQKIETEPKISKYIITVHGVGYRFGGG
jgi:DNA-binding response OmpR family regulator